MSGWEVGIRKLYNSMVVGSMGFRRNQTWQVTFKSLQRFSICITLSTPATTKYSINKSINCKFDQELNTFHHFREIGQMKGMRIYLSLKSLNSLLMVAFSSGIKL